MFTSWRQYAPTATAYLTRLLLVATPLVAVLVWGWRDVFIRRGGFGIVTAVLAMAVVGRLVLSGLRWWSGLDREQAQALPPAGLFTFAFLGQLALLALYTLATPLLALARDLTDHVVSLRWTVPVVVVAAAAWQLRGLRGPLRARWGDARAALARFPSELLVLAGLLVILLARAGALHGFHVGPLGLDTHRDMYLANQALDEGYLALTHRGTNWLDYYPRHFHFMAALWAAAGLQLHIGSAVKLMPFVQNLIVIGCFAELMLAAQRAQAGTERRSILWAALAAVFIVHHALTYESNEGLIYPFVDLSGSPRFATAVLVYTPLLLVIADRVRVIPRGALLALIFTPSCLAMAAAFNPANAALAAFHGLPAALFTYLLTWRRDRSRPALGRRKLAVALSLAGAMTLLSVLENPFFLSHMMGWRPVKMLVSAIDLQRVEPKRPNQFWMSPPPPPRCATMGCYLSRLVDVTPGVVEGWFVGLGERSLAAWQLFDGNKTSRRVVVLALPLLALVAFAVRRGTIRGSTAPGMPRIALAIPLAMLLSTLPHHLGQAFIYGLQKGGGLFSLLNIYYSWALWYFGAATVAFLVGGTWALLPRLRGRWLVDFAAVTLALIEVAAVTTDHRPTGLLGHANVVEGARVGRKEWRAVTALNDIVPPEDTVLTPAFHGIIGEENHVIPFGVTANVMPFFTFRTLFNISLGFGAPWGWQDISERLCSPSPHDRAQLLREAGVKWLVMRDAKVGTQDFYDTFRWPQCETGITLRDLWVAYPPVWSQHDLALFRIRIPAHLR